MTLPGYHKYGAVSERDFQRQVRDIASLHGWDEHVVYNSRRSPEGWPDLFFVRVGACVVPACKTPVANKAVAFECKTEKGKATYAQRHWLNMLDGVPGITAMLIRPSDIDKVIEVLR